MDIATRMAAQGLIEREMERLQALHRFLDYYEGRHRRFLRPTRDGHDDNIVLNRCAILVDLQAHYLFGKGIHVQVGDERRDIFEAHLVDVMKRNRFDVFLMDLAVTGSIFGHYFIKILPADPVPRLVLLDPLNVTILAAPDDIEDVGGYRIRYFADRDGRPVLARQDVIRDDRGRWWVLDGVEEGRVFRIERRTEWPYPFAPIVDGKNLPAPHSVYGRSDLERVIQTQDAINFLASSIRRVLRLRGHPVTVIRGAVPKDVDLSPDRVLFLPKDAEISSLEMSGDLSAMREMLDRLIDHFDEQAFIPRIALGRIDVSSVSGVALQINFRPLLAVIEAKRRLYGHALATLFRRLLVMRFGGREEDYDVQIVWPDILPVNAQEAVQTALLKMQVGVSQETLLRELGYDPEVEAIRRRVGAEDAAEQLLQALERRGEAEP
jgi:hypothetical protein